MALNCRLCNSVLHSPKVHIESMPLTDDFISVNEIHKKEYLADIDIYECEKCGLVQNPTNFHFEGYYKDYQYTSGHSEFVKIFMRSYAEVVINAYKNLNGSIPKSVLEIGSGDGEQLLQFKNIGIEEQLGIEPSKFLANQAAVRGIDTVTDLFNTEILEKISKKYDLCISSYTLDHITSPSEYLITAHNVLNDGGILAFEVHDLNKILDRSEYCLFEHEHTIYLNEEILNPLLNRNGFELVHINPLKEGCVRANSLIVLAKKIEKSRKFSELEKSSLKQLSQAQDYVESTIIKIDNWIRSLPQNIGLVGFGAGGRGVMTLASLIESKRFVGVFDSNFKSDLYLMPKSRVPIYGLNELSKFSDCYCLVFSYGYLDEITEKLLAAGFEKNKIFSLKMFYS